MLVLQNEQLSDPGFLASLTAFLSARPIAVEWGAHPNKSLSYEKSAFLRVCNHFTYSSFRPSGLLSKRLSTAAVSRGLGGLPFGNSDRSFLDEPARASIAELYADSNRQLADTAGITLATAYP